MLDRDALKPSPVAVLLGGRSTEREVSLATGRAVVDALSGLGYRAVPVDVDTDVARRLDEIRPAAAFVALHGRWGEDGCIQGLLETMGVPYTGSGVLASALAMDKALSKHLFTVEGLPTPEYRSVPPARAGELRLEDLPFGLPVVVKPAREGSSVGISLVKTAEAFAPALALAAEHAGDVLVERFVRGREISVALLDGEALGAIEIQPAREFYDYVAKYDKTAGTRYVYPAPLTDRLWEELRALAEQAHRLLGCSGVSRVDFLVEEEARPYLIEVNTLPGLTGTSLVPKIAAGRGIDYPALCERILLGASLKA